jgi:hypothetical protein
MWNYSSESESESVDAPLNEKRKAKRQALGAINTKIHRRESKYHNMKYRFISEKEKKMRNLEKYRSRVEQLQSQIGDSDGCKADERRAINDERVALLKLRQKLAKKQYNFDMMVKEQEYKMIHECFRLKHFILERRIIHQVYSDTSSSSDSDSLEERVPKRAKKELEAAGPQNAENISPPLEDAAATQSPASPSPGNVAVCGQV